MAGIHDKQHALDSTDNHTVAGFTSGQLVETGGAPAKARSSGVTTADAADAVAKKHVQGTDLGLDTGGVNPVTAAQLVAVRDDTGNLRGGPVFMGRNHASGGDQWLRGNDGIPLNISPLIAPFAMRLVSVGITVSAAGTTDVEVHSGAAVRVGGTPVDGTEDALLVLTAALQAYTQVSVDYAAGDEVGVYLRGDVSDPRVQLWFKRIP